MSDEVLQITDLPPRWWGLIEQRARATPDRIMLSDDRGRRLTFAGFRDVAERVAAGLLESGVRPGNVVSWQLPTVLEAVVLKAALARLDVTQNPIIPILRHAEVRHIVGQAKSDLLITAGVWRNFDYPAMARTIADELGCRTFVVDHNAVSGDALALPMGDTSTLPPPPVESGADEVRWIYYSSGTTAAPKGARHTDQSVMGGSNGSVFNAKLIADDVFPMAFPITHIGGHCFVTSCLRLGCSMVLMEAFDLKRSPSAMAEVGATILGSALPFFQAYLAAQREHGSEKLFPRLRVAMQGGAPIPPEMHYTIKEELGGIGVLNGWGLTEFPVATTAVFGDPDEVLATTVGKLCRGVELRVVSMDGREMPDGEEGELRVRGPQMLVGYVDASLDAEAFDDKGFFRTGDLGTVDADGNVRVTGRLKDIIIRNAENISATEVEGVLHTHPAIADIAVVGVPDPVTGERACAVIVLAPGYTTITLGDIGEHCRAQGLSAQKIPERLQFVSELPRNAMGKLLKQQIRAALI